MHSGEYVGLFNQYQCDVSMKSVSLKYANLPEVREAIGSIQKHWPVVTSCIHFKNSFPKSFGDFTVVNCDFSPNEVD